MSFARQVFLCSRWPVACQVLSEDFIREFKYKVDWDYISQCQKLSEEFIMEFKNEVNWYIIRVYQKLSEEFRKKIKEGIR